MDVHNANVPKEKELSRDNAPRSSHPRKSLPKMARSASGTSCGNAIQICATSLHGITINNLPDQSSSDKKLERQVTQFWSLDYSQDVRTCFTAAADITIYVLIC